MPIYEYQCADCGHQLEALQKLSDAPLATCPECQADTLKKKISAPGFRLAGSGWYETDFKADKQRNLSKADSGDKGGKDGKDGKAAPAAGESGKSGPTGGEAGKGGKSTGGGAKEAVA